MEATLRSFGKKFGVKMKTQILPGNGFISDNDSYQFGTSGHEELLLSKHPRGTLIDYTYQVAIHKKWLRAVAAPLLRWYSMKYWEKAVIDRLKNSLRNNIKIYRGPTPDFWILLQEIGRRGAFAGLGDHF